jgi:hypothetical protein
LFEAEAPQPIPNIHGRVQSAGRNDGRGESTCPELWSRRRSSLRAKEGNPDPSADCPLWGERRHSLLISARNNSLIFRGREKRTKLLICAPLEARGFATF